LCVFLYVILFVFFFFFFQAEDGIRDRTVTGVQTCALPISLRVKLVRYPEGVLPADRDQAVQTAALERVADAVQAVIALVRVGPRSEERRVGKECRCRWAGDR